MEITEREESDLGRLKWKYNGEADQKGNVEQETWRHDTKTELGRQSPETKHQHNQLI